MEARPEGRTVVFGWSSGWHGPAIIPGRLKNYGIGLHKYSELDRLLSVPRRPGNPEPHCHARQRPVALHGGRLRCHRQRDPVHRAFRRPELPPRLRVAGQRRQGRVRACPGGPAQTNDGSAPAVSPGGLGGGRADPGTGRQLLRVSYYGAGGPGGPRLPRRPRPGRPGAVAALRYRRGRPHARPEDCQQAASGSATNSNGSASIGPPAASISTAASSSPCARAATSSNSTGGAVNC